MMWRWLNNTHFKAWSAAFFCTSALLLYTGTLNPAARAGEANYLVGVARADITPEYPVRLNGFGSRRKEAEGVSQRLWAKALAISSKPADPPLLIIAIDNLGIPQTMTNEIANALAQKYKLPRANIALTFTHTHCAPKVNGASDTIFSSPIPSDHQAHIDRYSRELPELLIKVAAEAIENRQPATLEWRVGEVDFAKNRRTPGGPVDHDLPMLVARAPDGTPRAIYISYACHCVTLSFNQYSGDWAGYAQELIERRYPDALALVSIGCGSDANPASGVTGDRVAVAAEQGQQIADEVARLLKQPGRPIGGEIAARLNRIELPLNDLPTAQQLKEAASQGGAAGYNAEWQLARLARGEPLVDALNYPIQTFTLGDDLHIVFLAGEVCVDYSLRLKRELNRDRVWINGYSNDFCAYIPSERLLKEGGYGGGAEIPYFALPTTLRAGLEQKIIDEVLRQTPQRFHASPATRGIPPKPPEQSLQCMATHPELTIELVAAEPLVADPVAIDFGLDGSLWVAEMPDYSRNVDEQFDPKGRIRRLIDEDGDGSFERATTFLEKLRFPTDVKVWRDGILVCDAPDVIFAADRDGDGQAEIRKILLTGFATHNPHARVNGLRLGLDGWLYGSGGLFGGQIRSSSGEVVDISNRDFRFHPATGEVEPAAGRSQQGRPRDDFDNWFGCTNSELLLHFPVDERYASRNPNLAPPHTSVSVPGPGHGQRLFPPRDLVLFELSGAPGRPTSACGAEIYRDIALGREYYGNAFICEPVNQIVHRLVLKRKGTTFSGQRAATEIRSEFLSSTDQWFRPVQVRTGPDGALYIVDMYRFVIEHPQWIPADTRGQLNLLAGQGKGRIYRVAPRSKEIDPLPKLDTMSQYQLASAMDSTNGPTRDNVQQILLEAAELSPEAIEQLVKITHDSKFPAARLQAAATLAVQNELDVDDLLPLLQHKSAEVRRCALRIGESLGPGDGDLAAAALDMTTDVSPAVRAQAAFTLGELPHVDPSDAFANLLLSAQVDSDEAFAVLSGLSRQNAFKVWRKVISRADVTQRLELIQELTRLTVPCVDSLQSTNMLNRLLALYAGSDESDRWTVLAEWMRSINHRELQPNERELPVKLRQRFSAEVDGAREVLRSPDANDPARIAAIKLISAVQRSVPRSVRIPKPAADRDLLHGQIANRYSPSVQTIALRELAPLLAGHQASELLDHWDNATPTLRRQLIDLLSTKDVWAKALLKSMLAGRIQGRELNASQRERLLNYDNYDIRRMAEQTFSSNSGGDQVDTTEKWQKALALKGDFDRGRKVFSTHCAACHKLDGAGHDVGPDLAALSNRTPRGLLVAITDPNRDIDTRYLNYVALTTDGLTVTGMLASESGTSITLVEREGQSHVLLRNQIDKLRATTKSMMPEELARDLTHQDVADLIAYLRPPRLPPQSLQDDPGLDTHQR